MISGEEIREGCDEEEVLRKAKWEEFKESITDEELESVADNIVKVTSHLLTLVGDTKGECPAYQKIQDEAKECLDKFNECLDKFNELSLIVGDTSYLWFKEKMDSFDMTKRFVEMVESHPNKGAIEFV